MKIAIEAQRIFRRNKHGMDFVVLEMIRQLQQIDTENEYFILTKSGDDECLSETPNFHIVRIDTPSYPLWEQWGLPRALRRIRPDVVHCTSNTAPLWGTHNLVLTLHDIIFLEKRDSGNKSLYQNMGWYYRRLVVPRILGKCSRIITVSDFERQNIISKTGIPASQIQTVYNGFGTRFTRLANYQPTVSKYIDAPQGYLFFLGNTDPKKNTKRVLQAYADYARTAQSPLPLLVADLKAEILEQYISELSLTDVGSLIRPSGYIDNSDLPAIYSGASAFIYTSLRESFGIPLLEAMACQTPVISSSISAIPEIAADGALLVDPYSKEQITEAINRVLTDPALADSLRQKGLERTRRFSWRHTAEDVLKIYNELK